jgi:hypothetical protein
MREIDMYAQQYLKAVLTEHKCLYPRDRDFWAENGLDHGHFCRPKVVGEDSS